MMNATKNVTINFDVNNWDEVKSRIRLCVRPVSEPGADELVKIAILDLEGYFYIPISEGRIMVDYKLAANWNVSYDELREAAIVNNEANTTIRTMNEVMSSMGMGGLLFPVDILVVTYKEMMFGSGAIADTGILDDCCRKLGTSEIIVIPSSIHELLIMSRSGENSEINKIIVEVNTSTVEEHDRLSNHCYNYKLESGHLVW